MSSRTPTRLDYDRRLGQPAFDWRDSGSFAVKLAAVLALLGTISFIVVTVLTKIETETGWNLMRDRP